MALTRKGASFVWTDHQQTAFDALKACLLSAPLLGFPTEDGQFLLDTDASLFAVDGVLNQIQDDREVVIVYASRSLRLSQRQYCTTRREMLAVVVMCTHFRSYLRGAQFTLRTDHSSLRWLQKFRRYSLEWFRLGRSVQAFLRSYGVGDCRLATCLWTRTGDYGAVELLRREFLSLLCQVGSVRR